MFQSLTKRITTKKALTKIYITTVSHNYHEILLCKGGKMNVGECTEGHELGVWNEMFDSSVYFAKTIT